jgi:hypothetical protein
MIDRILHISHKFAGEYNKELLQRAAEIYIYKGPGAVVRHLAETEKMEAAAAQVLTQKIAAEMRNVNRSMLLQYLVILLIFLTVAVFGLISRSYIFAAFFALPSALLLYSMIKFLRRNPIR